MARMQWEALPASRVAAVESRTGPIVKAEAVTGGIMPGLAAVLHTGDSRYFLKAAPETSTAYRLHQREIAANAAMPADIPAPPMLLSTDDEGWAVILFAYQDGTDADLSPASPDLPGVLATLAAISSAPAPGSMVRVTANVAALRDKAAALPGADAGYPWDMYRAATTGFTGDCVADDRLVHYDLHAANLKVTEGEQVTAFDWSFACSGASWVDAALLAPRFIQAGHSPTSAENLLLDLPAYWAAPATAVTALSALWAMFREYQALHGPHEERQFRAHAAEAGRAWISYRTG
jgi:aminoglycoside phosphotransferase (APT) family kinase protein